MKGLKCCIWLLLVGFVVLLSACGGGGGDDTGTVQLALTDAVDHNYSEVVVAIKEVRAVPAGREGAPDAELPLIVAFATPKVVNVLDLAFQQQFLGEATVPAGTYNQLRLVLEANTDPLAPANYIIFADDPTRTKTPLNTPSGQQSGLKVLGRFAVEPGEITAVVLDFDPTRAIEDAGTSGKWQFQPTGIRLVQAEAYLPTYGTIIGQVVQESVNATGQKVQTPVTNAIVSAVPEGGTTAIAAGSVNTVDGSFRLLLPSGSYRVKVASDGLQPYSSATPLTVVAGAETAAGTILLVPAAVK